MFLITITNRTRYNNGNQHLIPHDERENEVFIKSFEFLVPPVLRWNA
jgi:hypothetical protein